MAARSFIEILEARIRADVREELRAEMAAEPSRAQGPRPASPPGTSAEAIELWLLNALKGPMNAGPAKANSARFARATKDAAKLQGREAKPERSQRQDAQPSLQGAQAEPSFRLDSGPAAFAREIFRRMGSELPEECTVTSIKSTYRKLALKHHPDRHQNAGPDEAKRASERFGALSDAYQTLMAECRMKRA